VLLRDIANGAYDSAYTAWAQQSKAWAHPYFLRWNAEMNGRWSFWGTTSTNSNTPAEFVAAWRHVHDIFANNGATNVTWVWCPNLEYSATTPIQYLYPGDAYVDWTCLDGYNKGGQYSTTFVNLFAASYRALLKLAPTKPIMIGETASVEDSGKKAAWITAALNALPAKFPRIKAFLWFNWQITEGGTTWQWQIESSPAAAAAFHDGIASRYFAAAGVVRLPRQMAAIAPPP
jgi:beta-mannanase